MDALTPIVFLCATVMLCSSERVMMRIFVVTILFQSAAAFKLGSNGITPGHFLLLIPAWRCFRAPARREVVLAMLRFPHTGFWLLLVCLYSVASGYFAPRLLAGMTLIQPIGTTAYEPSVNGVPLGPSSGNVTQSVYMIGSTLAYLVVAEHTSTPEGLKNFRSAFYLYCLSDIAFGLFDLAGLGDLLSIVHNGNYSLHLEETQSGLKRIAGAFSEAAAFATATMGIVGFAIRLCLGNVDAGFTAALALVATLLLFLSTSSTAYASVPVLLLCFYAWACGRSLIGVANPNTVASTVLVPLTAAVVVLAVLMNDAAHDALRSLLDDIVFNKSTSLSAVERGALNRQAVVNFRDTFGVGAGAGSARASSFPLAVLANLGLPGAISYLMFLGQTFLGPPHQRRNGVAWHVRGACRWGAFGVLIAETVSGTLVDLGILFFVLAAAGSAPSAAIRSPSASRASSAPHGSSDPPWLGAAVPSAALRPARARGRLRRSAVGGEGG